MFQDLQQLHAQVLYTQVRVRTDKAGGSGTVVYSKAAGDEYSTYVITCHHVISEAVTIKKEWDSKIGRERKKEYRQLVKVEFFDFGNAPHGHRPVTHSCDADIVAYDAAHDVALLRLRTIRAAQAVATLMTLGNEKVLRIGSPVVAVGCAMLHDPILTQGIITHMGDEIDYKRYWMSNAQIIFGNSGGAMFAQISKDEHDEFEFIGIPSRIDIAGWASPITHLGYFSPISRVCEFFEEQVYDFLIPGNGKTESECAKERETQKKKEVEHLRVVETQSIQEGAEEEE